MTLQLVGLVYIIIGITKAAAATRIYNYTESEEGKFNFCYQWCKTEFSVTAWRNLRNERYKHYSS